MSKADIAYTTNSMRHDDKQQTPLMQAAATCCVAPGRQSSARAAAGWRRKRLCRPQPPDAGRHGARARLAPSPCAAWLSRGAAAPRANFGRNQPQRRPFCRSDTHPRPRRPAAARASISWRSASAGCREQSSSRSREIVTLRNYLGNGEADESAARLGLILAMPSTCDIRGVWAES